MIYCLASSLRNFDNNLKKLKFLKVIIWVGVISVSKHQTCHQYEVMVQR